MADSIIFDLDGTIWDSIDTVILAWNETLKQSDHTEKQVTRHDFEDTMGLTMTDIGKKLFPELEEQAQISLLEKCGKAENGYIRQRGGALYPNVEKILDELSSSYKLFIVSNCQDGYIEAFFDYHRLGHLFQDYENPGRTGLPKGDNIKLIVERNQLVSPIYVGDTVGDANASKDANVPFVYAKYGFGNVAEFDASIDDFNELLTLDYTTLAK
ncbi:HAD family hydrolase [Paenalkalicoccus suaedae]|nr:HAD family hydrolase [Paenalkalicoccus suaedae]